MSQLLDILERFTLKDFKRGYVKLSDNSIAIMRVAIVNAKPLQGPSLYEVQFEVTPASGISILPSQEAINEVKDKPIIELGKIPTDGWTLIDIVEKQSAYEEVEYILNEKEKYIIRAEMEVLMASKNTNYRTIKGEPIYNIGSAVKITWKKGE